MVDGRLKPLSNCPQIATQLKLMEVTNHAHGIASVKAAQLRVGDSLLALHLFTSVPASRSAYGIFLRFASAGSTLIACEYWMPNIPGDVRRQREKLQSTCVHKQERERVKDRANDGITQRSRLTIHKTSNVLAHPAAKLRGRAEQATKICSRKSCWEVDFVSMNPNTFCCGEAVEAPPSDSVL